MNTAPRVSLSIFISLLLALILIVLMIGIGVHQYLYPKTYQTVFEEHGVYELFDTYLRESEAFSLTSLAQEQTHDIVNRMVSDVLAYVRGEREELNFTLTIDEATVRSALAARIAALPVCDSRDGTMQQECRPAGIAESDLIDVYLAQHNLTSIAPEKINLAEILDPDHHIEYVREYVKFFRIGLWVLGATVLVLIIILGSIQHSWQRTERWVGAVLGISGAIILSALWYGRSALTLIPLPPQISPLGSALALPFFATLQMMGITLIIVGIVVFAVSFLPTKSPPPQVQNKTRTVR